MSTLRAGLTLAVAGIAGAGGASTAPQAAGPGGPIQVKAADSACDVSTGQAPAGTINFSIVNTGTKVTEFYLYATGDRIIGEVENIGPGLTRQLTVEVPAGQEAAGREAALSCPEGAIAIDD